MPNEKSSKAQAKDKENRLNSQNKIENYEFTSTLSKDHSISSLKKHVLSLELKVAYQERLNQDLSDQIYALHKEFELLRNSFQILKEQLKQKTNQGLEIGPADEPPPHY